MSTIGRGGQEDKEEEQEEQRSAAGLRRGLSGARLPTSISAAPSPASSTSSLSPAAWALQFGITDKSGAAAAATVKKTAAETHPLMADPPPPPASPLASPLASSPASSPRNQRSASASTGLRDDFASSPAATVDGGSTVGGGSEPGTPAASASSAASGTATPDTASRTSRSRPSGDYQGEDSDWGENSADDSEPSRSFKKKLSMSEASSHLANLQQLMRQGSWAAILDKVKDAKKRSLPKTPDEALVYSTYHVLALMKLRNFPAAQMELTTLGDLNSAEFRYEKHPQVYPNKSGSMVPFALRWLHAELPHRLGSTPATIDRLYDLLAHCTDRIDFLESSAKRLSPDNNEGGAKANPSETRADPVGNVNDNVTPAAAAAGEEEKEEETPSSSKGDEEKGNSAAVGEEQPSSGVEEEEDPSSSRLEHVGSNYIPPEALEDDDFGEFVTSALDKESGGDNVVYSTLIHRWKRRREVVLCSVLAHHLERKDFAVCLNWLQELIKKRPEDVVLLSKLGYVQLQLGDLHGSRRTFAAVEATYEQQGRSSSPLPASLLSRNRGLLFFSLKQYAKAVKEFDAALALDPNDAISSNNKALCLMYSRDLVGATQVLETVLQSTPITALNETLVLNLCSMYELASMNSVESKKTLSSWIRRVAPDDFDLTCTRL